MYVDSRPRRTLFTIISTWLRAHEHLAYRGLVVLGIGAALSIVLQLLWPSSRTLPFVHAGGTPVGMSNQQDISTQLTAYFKDAALTVKTGDKQTAVKLADIGIRIDPVATAKAATRYAFWQRLIPYSSIGIMIGRNTQPITHINQTQFASFTKTVESSSFVAAKDAAAGVKKGKAVLVPSLPSQAYPASDIARAITEATLTSNSVVVVKAVTQPAKRTDDQVKDALADVQKMIDRPVTQTVPNGKTTIPKETLVTWVDFTSGSNGKLSVIANETAITNYVTTLKAKTDQPTTKTVVTIVDGAEIKRINGDGLSVAVLPTVTAFEQALNGSGKADVTVVMAVVTAPITYDRSYSQTSQGLTALVNDIVKAKGNYGIAAVELGNKNRTGSASGDKQFTSASTFKLFVAYGVFQAIKNGTMSWSDIIDGGRTADQCFDDMIVVSDNNCAIAFGELIGWSTIDTEMDNLGLKHTQVVRGDQLTTANDLALYLKKLQEGSLVSGSDRTKLINDMKRDIYRSGIPAGTSSVVANKVGFVDDYLNDAGIVYAPKATYVLVILTKGGSWSGIANATKQINSYLNQ